MKTEQPAFTSQQTLHDFRCVLRLMLVPTRLSVYLAYAIIPPSIIEPQAAANSRISR